ncbi:MAG: hypothetical protein WD250_06795 [Egibacteraceae bacterium]
MSAAVGHLRCQTLEIEPRKPWPQGVAGVSERIRPKHQLLPGRSLSVFVDSRWTRLVDVGVEPLTSRDYWWLIGTVKDPATLLGADAHEILEGFALAAGPAGSHRSTRAM